MGSPARDPRDDALDDAVARLPYGDDDAFRTVYRAVQPLLLRYLTTLVGLVEAEDVASETWSQAVRDLGRFEGDADGFRGWIVTIGRHRALDHLRARARRPAVPLPSEDLPVGRSRDDTEASVLRGESTRAAVDLIAALPREQAEAVMLRAVLGLDAATAARVLGKRPGAVRTAAHRGLRALARRLDPEPVTATAPAVARATPGDATSPSVADGVS